MKLLEVRFRCPECGEEVDGMSCCDGHPFTILWFCHACNDDAGVDQLEDLLAADLVVSIDMHRTPGA